MVAVIVDPLKSSNINQISVLAELAPALPQLVSSVYYFDVFPYAALY